MNQLPPQEQEPWSGGQEGEGGLVVGWCCVQCKAWGLLRREGWLS